MVVPIVFGCVVFILIIVGVCCYVSSDKLYPTPPNNPKEYRQYKAMIIRNEQEYEKEQFKKKILEIIFPVFKEHFSFVVGQLEQICSKEVKDFEEMENKAWEIMKHEVFCGGFNVFSEKIGAKSLMWIMEIGVYLFFNLQENFKGCRSNTLKWLQVGQLFFLPEEENINYDVLIEILDSPNSYEVARVWLINYVIEKQNKEERDSLRVCF